VKAKRLLDISSKIETREKDGKRYIDGLVPFGSMSEDLGGFIEKIDRTAFNKTLADGAEVYAFWSHNDSEVLGSRSAGTLTLAADDVGLHFSVEMRDNAISEDRWQAVQRGDVVGTSFGFITERDEWDHTTTPAVRTLKEVRLLEISPGVAFPAYPGAQSGAAFRSVVNEVRSMKEKPADVPPATEAAPPAQAPGNDSRAEADAMKRRQEDALALIKAKYGF
jgi:uncharacterized protein